MRFLNCSHCGQRVFFENTHCENCGSALGYAPEEQNMVAFTVEADGQWTRLGPPGPALLPCANYANEQVCNWMVPADSGALQCASCVTTHTIPALSKFENRASWAALEKAKRRLFYTLFALGLPAPSKDVDPVNGLRFDFLEQIDPATHVLTGHDEGVITLNIAEANDAEREHIRLKMHEPYRTLLGHFRHESGHYYWDRLICDTPWIEEYRALFGDERADYAQALEKHYKQPATNWSLSHISLYASSHPWEDWAECWAHYLHMVEGLETAEAWGLQLAHAMADAPGVSPHAVDLATPSVDEALIQHWLPVSQFVNAMNRSLGVSDSYPFVISAPVVCKLDFIHRVLGAARRGDSRMNFASA
jgi:hypothetical protein